VAKNSKNRWAPERTGGEKKIEYENHLYSNITEDDAGEEAIAKKNLVTVLTRNDGEQGLLKEEQVGGEGGGRRKMVVLRYKSQRLKNSTFRC